MITKSIETIIQNAMANYAKDIILDRALPDVRDGLKPVQRRILYTMRSLKLLPQAKTIKSARIVGECFVAGTKILTTKGLMNIEDIKIGDFVATPYGFSEVDELYGMPDSPIVEIELENGIQIVSTLTQEYKTIGKNNKIVTIYAKDIKPNDILIVKKNSSEIGNLKNVDYFGAYALGFLFGNNQNSSDNALRSKSFSIKFEKNKVDERTLKDFFYSRYGYKCKIDDDNSETITITIYPQKSIINFLSKQEPSNKNGDTLFVPPFLFQSSLTVRHAFVGGLFDAKGILNKEQKMALISGISSEKFARDMQILMLNSGLHSILKSDRYGQEQKFSLGFNGKDYLDFIKEIRFYSVQLFEFFNKKEDFSSVEYSHIYSLDEHQSKEFLKNLWEIQDFDKTINNFEEKNQWLFIPVKQKRLLEKRNTFDVRIKDDHHLILPNNILSSNCLGKFHPHGDSSVYGALVRMTQDFSLREPLIEGQGNFGSIDGDGAAAMRYCVTGETQIITDQGVMTIKSAHDKKTKNNNFSLKVLGIENKFVDVSKTFYSGKHPVITIETETGIVLSGTKNHPILIENPKATHGFEWILLENIKPGMKAIVYNKTPEKILTKRDDGIKDVYSLRVESKTHSFVTNGLFSHNTEAKLSELGELLLQDVDKNAVDMVSNFDGTEKEPVVLPAKIPNLLVNGSSGIAVGMSTSILPHNLNEVCKAVIYVAKNWKERKKITVDDLMKIIPGPDLPTGGIIYRFRKNPKENTVSDQIRTAYETGYSPIICQAKIDIEPNNGKNKIVVTEIPYQITKGAILEKIATIKEKFIGKISDVVDESDQSGIRIVFDVARGADPQDVLETLLNYTDLRTTLSINHLALNFDENENIFPEIMPLKNIIEAFIRHRLSIITRTSEYDKARAEKRLHIVSGLLVALEKIEEVIAIIKKSKTPETAKSNLSKLLKIDDLQCQAILDMQIRRLASLEVKNLVNEKKELERRIKELSEILSSETKKLQIIIAEMEEINQKFVRPRKTVILFNDNGDTNTVTLSELSRPKKSQAIFVTNNGINRMDLDKVETLYKTKSASYKSLIILPAEPSDDIVFFTDKGRTLVIETGRIDNTIGKSLAKEEKVVSMARKKINDFFILLTKNGNIKKSKISDLKVTSRFETAIGLDTYDSVVSGFVANENDKVLILTKGNFADNIDAKGLVFDLKNVNAQSSNKSKGVLAIKLQKDDNLIYAERLSEEKPLLFLITDSGFYKLLNISDFPTQGRGGQGVLVYKNNEKFGNIKHAVFCSQDDILEIILSGKQRLFKPVKDLVIHKRNAKPEMLNPEWDNTKSVVSIDVLLKNSKTRKERQ